MTNPPYPQGQSVPVAALAPVIGFCNEHGPGVYEDGGTTITCG